MKGRFGKAVLLSMLTLLFPLAVGGQETVPSAPVRLTRMEPGSQVRILANGMIHEGRFLSTTHDTLFMASVHLGIASVDSVWAWQRRSAAIPIIVGAVGGAAVAMLFSGQECNVGWVCRDRGPDANEVAKWAAIGAAMGVGVSFGPRWRHWRLIYARPRVIAVGA